MRKSTLFISTVLTIFMMATIFGVASAYQQIVRNQSTAAQVSAVQVAPVVQVAPAQPVASVPTLTIVTPEQATTIASTFLNDTSVYSVEQMFLSATGSKTKKRDKKSRFLLKKNLCQQNYDFLYLSWNFLFAAQTV